MRNIFEYGPYTFRVTDEFRWGYTFTANNQNEFKTSLIKAMSEYRMRFGEKRCFLTPQTMFNGEGFMIRDQRNREVKIREIDVFTNCRYLSEAAFRSAWGTHEMIGRISSLTEFLRSGESRGPQLSLIRGGKYHG